MTTRAAAPARIKGWVLAMLGSLCCTCAWLWSCVTAPLILTPPLLGGSQTGLSETRLTYSASPIYLARRGAPRNPSEILDHDCIIDSNFRAGISWPFSGPNGAEHIDVNGRLRADSASVARRFALKDCGVLLSPEYVVADDIKSGRLVPVLENHWPATLGIFAVYLENRHLSAKVRVFVDFMRAALK